MSDFLCSNVEYSSEATRKICCLEDIFSDDFLDNCSLADRSSSYKTNELNQKSLLATGTTYVKPKVFICYFESCRKEFQHHHSLQKHERIHRGEKPFVCEVCSHAFTQHSNLKRHEKYHTGEKPYVCPYCPKTFANNSNLKQHVQIHRDHNSRSKFVCPICSRYYYNQSSMKKHLKEHHQAREGFDSPSTMQSEIDIKPERKQWFTESEAKKQVKLCDDAESETIEKFCYSQTDFSFLPVNYQNIIANKKAMKDLQNIVLECVVQGANGQESFEKILKNFQRIFDTTGPELSQDEAIPNIYSSKVQPREGHGASCFNPSATGWPSATPSLKG